MSAALNMDPFKIIIGIGDYPEKHNSAMDSMTAYASGLLTVGLNILGFHDASTGAFPVGPSNGDSWVINVQGTISGTVFFVGDVITFSTSIGDWVRTITTSTATETFTGTGDGGTPGFIAQSDLPNYTWIENDAAANEGRWRATANNGIWSLSTRNDVDSTGKTIFQVTRTETAVDSIIHGDAADNPDHIFNGNAGFGIATPDQKIHAHVASAGAVTANSVSQIVAEAASNAGYSALTGDAGTGFYLFGAPADNAYAQIRGRYNAGSSQIDFFLNGAVEILFEKNKGMSFDGGTNFLDQYDPAAFTPTIGTDGTAFSTLTYLQQIGFHIEFTDFDIIFGKLETNAVAGGSGFVKLESLPATIRTGGLGAVAIINASGFSAATTPFGCNGISATNSAFFRRHNTSDSRSASNQPSPVADWNGGEFLEFWGIFPK